MVIKTFTAYREYALKVTVLKTQDTKETCLPTVKNTLRKMPRVPAHLREHALGML